MPRATARELEKHPTAAALEEDLQALATAIESKYFTEGKFDLAKI